MDNILLLDTSVGSLNKGDEIIMKCVRRQLSGITSQANVFTVPTHLSLRLVPGDARFITCSILYKSQIQVRRRNESIDYGHVHPFPAMEY